MAESEPSEALKDKIFEMAVTATIVDALATEDIDVLAALADA